MAVAAGGGAEVLRQRGHDIEFVDGSGNPAEVTEQVARIARLER